MREDRALLARHNELLDGLRGELALNRAEFAVNRAAIYEAKNAIRSMAAGIDQNTRVLQALEVEIHQNTEQTRAVTGGLLRVLDELRDDPPDLRASIHHSGRSPPCEHPARSLDEAARPPG